MVSNNEGDFFILWRIENFDLIGSFSDYDIWTSLIPSKKLIEVDLVLMICPLDTEKNYISIYLQQCKNVDSHAITSFDVEFCLIDKNGDEQFKQKCNDCEISKTPLCNVTTFLRADTLFANKDEFIPNGVLTLVCRGQKSAETGSGFTGMKIHVCTEILVERSLFHWSIPDPNLDLVKIIRLESDFVESGFEVKCESLKNKNENFLNFIIKPISLPISKTVMSITIQATCSQKNIVSKVEGIYVFKDEKDPWYLESLDIKDLAGNHQELDLSCEFSISIGNFKSHVQEILFYPVKIQSKVITLKDDIGTLFESLAWVIPLDSKAVTNVCNTDIILCTSNYPNAFPAHKMILAARSPVFRDILKSYDLEKKMWLHITRGREPIIECKVTAGNGRFKVFMNQGLDTALISGVSLQVLLQLVWCMYLDTLDIRDVNNAIELYRVGNDFQFNLLKSKSRNYLRSKVSLLTLGDLLPFAYEVGDEWLKHDFLHFISKNRNSVFLTNEWASLSVNFASVKKVVLTDLQSNYGIY